jgi:hypothetical protein
MTTCPIARKEAPALAPPAEMQAQLRPAEMQGALPARLAEMQAELVVRFAQMAMPARSLRLHLRPRMQDS